MPYYVTFTTPEKEDQTEELRARGIKIHLEVYQ
jgi:hypothetical protein